MSRKLSALAALLIAGSVQAAETPHYGFGTPVTEADIAAWNIDVRPDGSGLPQGHGTVTQGAALYAERCASCHGAQGEGGTFPVLGAAKLEPLVGGQGSLATPKALKTIGSYWPYATTLYDFIRRAMPYNAPQSLSSDEVYALVAFLLNLNGILPADAALDQTTLAKVQLPNRDGFVPSAPVAAWQKQ